jgi:hypothetical protein
LCYAKITPAALHRGENRPRGHQASEAAGTNQKFGSGDFPRGITGAPWRSLNAPEWPQVGQSVPDA